MRQAMRVRQMFTPEEVAEALRITPAEVSALITAGELGAVELVPGIVRIAPRDLQVFLRVRRRDFLAATGSERPA